MRQSQWYRLAMIGAMAVVFLNTWLAVRALRTLFDAETWRSHSLEILTHTESMALEIHTADSAVRAYMLTGDPSYEQRYRVAGQGIYQEIDAVRDRTMDNGSQQQRLVYLRSRVIVKLAALDNGVAMRHSTPGPLNLTVLQPTLADSPDGGPSVYYCITQIEAEEQRLLNNRTEDTQRAETLVRWSFLGASILDLLLILAAGQLLIRVVHDRQVLADRSEVITDLNTKLTDINSELEIRVAQRTHELAVSNQELEAFSYSVSHDLRAPLRTIDGFSLALQEDFADKLTDEGRDYITRVRSGVQRMGQLIDALLQLSRVTRADLMEDRVDLSQMVTLVFNEFLAADPNRKIELIAQPGVLVLGDSRLLRAAIENLIGNAFKFTSRTPDAHVEFGSILETGNKDTPGRTVYYVRDNGAGFDMQYVDRLFTAFQRLHGDRDFKGSGIGLATVSRIIRRHHGEIWAEGKIGEGAAFFFTLAP